MAQTENYKLPCASTVEADAGELLKSLFVDEGGFPSAMQIIDKALKAHDEAIAAQKINIEHAAISGEDWKDLSDNVPFQCSADVSVSTQISESTIVKLYNDNSKLFSTYGFQISAAENTNITIFALTKPSESVSLTIGVIGG